MSDTKEHILLTSLQLFLHKNYKDVTLTEIVRQTGLSKGAFYHYFDSKEAVFEAVIKYFFDQKMFFDMDSLSNCSLKMLCTGYIKNLENIDKRFSNISESINIFGLFREAAKRLPDFFAIHKKQQKEEFNRWYKAVCHGRQTNEVMADLSDEAIAGLFINLLHGMMLNKATRFYDSNQAFLNDLTLNLEHLYALVCKT